METLSSQPQKRSQGRAPRAFTLIELLVVIAIVAILAALLFPVFTRAKMAVQRSACLSNLRQLAGAAHLYANQWNDRYPLAKVGYWPWGHFKPETNRPPMGPRALEPYLKSIDALFCPSQIRYKPHTDWGPGTEYYCGYAYWANYFGYGLDRQHVAVRAGEYPGSLIFADIIVTKPKPANGLGLPSPLNNHMPNDNQGGHLLYNDGHVKWKWMSEMKVFYTSPYIPGGPPQLTFYW